MYEKASCARRAVLFDLDNRLICCTTNEGSLVVSGYEKEGRTRNPNELIHETPSVFSMRADDDWLHFRAHLAFSH